MDCSLICNVFRCVDELNSFLSNMFVIQLTTSALLICGSILILTFVSGISL